MSHRRPKRMREPAREVVTESVATLVATARQLAQCDHMGSLLAGRELDGIAEVYLRRALDQIRGLGPDEELACAL